MFRGTRAARTHKGGPSALVPRSTSRGRQAKHRTKTFEAVVRIVGRVGAGLREEGSRDFSLSQGTYDMTAHAKYNEKSLVGYRRMMMRRGLCLTKEMTNGQKANFRRRPCTLRFLAERIGGIIL